MEITLEEMLECAKRELAMRKRVYPNWVAQKRMIQKKADTEIAGMDAIVQYLSAQLDNEQGGLGLEF